MTRHPEPGWMPLLVPDMPSPQALMPWLERMQSARHYSNFGPLVRELEAEFAQRFALPVEQVTTVANATQGLELVLQALGLPTGARVLLPTFTFVASATAVLLAGLVPVLADVDPCSWMMTPDIARAACAGVRIDAVLTVATFGMPHDMQAWQQFEQDTGVPVIVDAAAAYGSQWLQGAQGTLVFSMHTTKSLPAGEGGLVVSTRPGLAARVRQLSNFGINLDPEAGLPVGALAHAGTNAKMSEYHAAIALEMLGRWELHAEERRNLHDSLRQDLNLASNRSLVWQAQGGGACLMAPTLLCAQLPSEKARDRLEQACRQARITTRRWYQPLLQHMDVLHKHCIVLETPHAEMLARTLLGLPFFMSMSCEQRRDILDVMRESMGSCVLSEHH